MNNNGDTSGDITATVIAGAVMAALANSVEKGKLDPKILVYTTAGAVAEQLHMRAWLGELKDELSDGIQTAPTGPGGFIDYSRFVNLEPGNMLVDPLGICDQYMDESFYDSGPASDSSGEPSNERESNNESESSGSSKSSGNEGDSNKPIDDWTADSDGDGTPNNKDDDDDNDGIPDKDDDSNDNITPESEGGVPMLTDSQVWQDLSVQFGSTAVYQNYYTAGSAAAFVRQQVYRPQYPW